MIRSILILTLLLSAGVAMGQQGKATLKGQVSDEFGGVIVGATVLVTDANGVAKTATTNGDGNYSIRGPDSRKILAAGYRGGICDL